MNKPFYSGYSFQYPDTSIVIHMDTTNGPIYQSWKTIEDSICYEPFLGKWTDFFIDKDSTYKLILFIFDSDTIEKYPWEVVRKEYKIRSRYMFTKKQLDSLNWRIHIY